MAIGFGGYWGYMFKGEMGYWNLMNLAVLMTGLLFTILPFYVPLLIILIELLARHLIFYLISNNKKTLFLEMQIFIIRCFFIVFYETMSKM